MVPVSIFVKEMRRHWEELGHVSSNALEDSWKQLAKAFLDHVKVHEDPSKDGLWTVLSLPTGTGKTEGTILYSAMLSQVLRVSPDLHPGILIVTKLIDDADNIAAGINRLSAQYQSTTEEGTGVAIAYHSRNKAEIRRENLYSFPVLVITHKAYELALDNLDVDALDSDSSGPSTWDCFHAFNGNMRKLVVIDEAIDLVAESQLDANEMRRLYGLIPDQMRREYGIEMLFLDELKDIFEKAPAITRGRVVPNEMLYDGEPMLETVMVLADAMEESEEIRRRVHEITGPLPPLDISLPEGVGSRPFPDFRGFRGALRRARLDREVWMEDADVHQTLFRRIDTILSSADAIYRQWQWYAKVEGRDTLNTARLLVPPGIKGAVVLDATAGENIFYEIFDRAKVIPPVPGTRRYNNVTLHTSRGHSVGKVSMRNNTEEWCTQLIANLETWAKGRRVLIITHLDLEDEVGNHVQRLCEDEGYTIQIAHWGAVNGSNRWKDMDTVIVFGLPYRPDTWPVNAFMACQGPQNTEWMTANGNRPFGYHSDIKESIIIGQLVTDVVQGINRIRCRNVIDSQGNCAKTDVYMLLPNGTRGEALFKGIKKAMPGIRTKQWKFTGRSREPRRTRYETELISYLRDSEKQRVLATEVRDKLGIPTSTFERLRRRARTENRTDTLVQGLTEVGYYYEVTQEGDTRKAYFRRMF
jgi:hypothetical protein